MKIYSDYKEPYDRILIDEEYDYIWNRKISEETIEINSLSIFKNVHWTFIVKHILRNETGLLSVGDWFYPVINNPGISSGFKNMSASMEGMYNALEFMNKHINGYLIKPLGITSFTDFISNVKYECDSPIWFMTVNSDKLIIKKNIQLYSDGFCEHVEQTAQNIEMWFSNRGLNKNPIPENTDEKYRMKSRFGHKYSFRKEPEIK